jgi:hypothetical protein
MYTDDFSNLKKEMSLKILGNQNMFWYSDLQSQIA